MNTSFDGVKYEDTVEFVMPIQYGKVVKVYDGDTITIASYLPIPNSPLYRFSVRLNGIDTPEIKGKTREEKDLALVAKNALSEMILGVSIPFKRTEKR